jgi:hypothetical protein
VPAIPPYIIEPIWEQFCALLPERKIDHPLGCHRRRIPDRVVFEKLVEILVFGCAYSKGSPMDLARRAHCVAGATSGSSSLGLMEQLRDISLDTYDRLIGLELGDMAVDGCATKAPCGGEKAGRNPVDRGKGGIERSTAVDASGIPLGTVTAPANHHDSLLLGETLDAVAESLGGVPERASVHLDRGYDSGITRERLQERGLLAEISEKGKPAPLEAGMRWIVERTNSWHNAHKKLVWCTERWGRVNRISGWPSQTWSS